ncbi:hypothetical protein FVB9532_03880 [Mesonia oceanica]|uniref:Uncharacterized protein n=1 Tax=Mesonia oceanica TaxID=2687242 RepID=A0AC61YE35_9FLAO|nr:hypothetical protein FVB9532_03880 [Mesonia oceanica]
MGHFHIDCLRVLLVLIGGRVGYGNTRLVIGLARIVAETEIRRHRATKDLLFLHGQVEHLHRVGLPAIVLVAQLQSGRVGKLGEAVHVKGETVVTRKEKAIDAARLRICQTHIDHLAVELVGVMGGHRYGTGAGNGTPFTGMVGDLQIGRIGIPEDVILVLGKVEHPDPVVIIAITDVKVFQLPLDLRGGYRHQFKRTHRITARLIVLRTYIDRLAVVVHRGVTGFVLDRINTKFRVGKGRMVGDAYSVLPVKDAIGRCRKVEGHHPVVVLVALLDRRKLLGYAWIGRHRKG